MISICIPCHNRTHDLKKTMPYLLEAAQACPPVEIVVVDYNSHDDLAEFMEWVIYVTAQPTKITYRQYTGRDYYHMAHARNLSVLAASGEYIVIHSTDIYPTLDYLPTVRQLAATGVAWMYDEKYSGVIAIRRDEFIAAGGYDERLEFYGPEDRDLHERLERRGLKGYEMPAGFIKVIPTPNEVKVKNYRLPLSKAQMIQRGHEILDENRRLGIIEANPEGWGSWT